MKILQIASGDFFSTYGGGQVYVKNIVDCMIAQEMEIAIVSCVYQSSGIKVRNYKGAELLEISDSSFLEEAINIAKPDIIHAHYLKDIACRIGGKLGIPVIVTAHHGGIVCPAGTLLNCKDEICHIPVSHKDCLPCVLRNTRTGLLWYPIVRHIPKKRYIALGEKLSHTSFIPFITPIGSAARHISCMQKRFKEIVQNATLIISPSQALGDELLRNGLAKEKLRVVPHGIPLPTLRASFPEVLNGSLKFYYVGRICYVKGIHILLKAFNAVRKPTIELHLIGGAGNKGERRYMHRLQKKFKSDTRIIWHGKIPAEKVFDETRNFHVSSSSSSYMEAFGLNIAEALALGKPVLATRSGGAEMQIVNDNNGWLVPTNDAKALAEKIRDISDHPEILKEMSNNCVANPIEKHVKDLWGTYMSVIAH